MAFNPVHSFLITTDIFSTTTAIYVALQYTTMATNKILVILGMHRSGTSLITRWLQACGLHIGDTLLGPQTGNDEGHFEDMDFIQLHQQLLVASRLPGTGLTDLPLPGLAPALEQQVQNLIDKKNDLHTQWAWKDPRTCMFLCIYRKLLPGAYYIIIFRDYQSVVSSLLNRDNKGLQRYYNSKGPLYKFFLRLKRKYNRDWLFKTHATKYLKVWIAYNEALLQHIEKIPQGNFIVVDYLALLDDDKIFFNHLTNRGFTLAYYDFVNVYNRQLLGQQVNIAALVDDTSLLSKARQLENRLRSAMTG